MPTSHIFLLATFLTLAGCCSQTPSRPDMAGPLTHATTFIQDGQSTREQVLLKLGIPSRQFEAGRILAWRVRTEGADLLTVSDYPGSDDPRYNTWPASSRGFDLIVVFDAHDLVQTHNLVPARR